MKELQVQMSLIGQKDTTPACRPAQPESVQMSETEPKDTTRGLWARSTRIAKENEVRYPEEKYNR